MRNSRPHKSTIIFLAVIIVLIIAIGVLLANRYYKAYEYKIERNVAIAQSLRETLAIKNPNMT